MSRKLLIFAAILVCITIISLTATQNRIRLHSGRADPSYEHSQGEAQIGGGFELVDQNGKSVRESDFRGKLMLVFFGFTHCPDICPVSVSNLSQTMGLLGDRADQVAPIFITVDPKRDTPAAMKEYLANFDPHFVGLTGSKEQIAQAVAAYKVYHAESPVEHATGEDESEEHHEHHHDAMESHEHGHAHDAAESASGEDYTVDHSGFIYLMGKDGKYIRHFAYDAAPQEIAAAVSAELK